MARQPQQILESMIGNIVVQLATAQSIAEQQAETIEKLQPKKEEEPS
jgi:uncharacterized protein YbcI